MLMVQVLERWSRKDPWGSLASELNLIGRL